MLKNDELVGSMNDDNMTANERGSIIFILQMRKMRFKQMPKFTQLIRH